MGSIVVNGVRFETTDAVVTESDDFQSNYGSGTSTFNSPLAMGMTVALFGDVDDAQQLGRAARIRLVGGVRGTLSAIDANALTLTLPTQVIQLSAATLYAGTSDGSPTGSEVSSLAQLAALAALGGQPLLTVYGQTQADGAFLATRVVLTQAQAHAWDVAVRGQVSAVSSAVSGSTYTVKTDAQTTLTVVCSAPCAVQPSGSVPVVGDEIRALAVDAAQWNGTTLNAGRLQLVNARYVTRFTGAPTSATYAKIKGVATGDGSRWWVGGVEVTVPGAPLTPGLVYEVKGTWSGTVLMASSLEVEGQKTFADRQGTRRAYSNELYGAVSQVNGPSFRVQGVLVNAQEAYFPTGSLAHLSPGDFVEVKGNYLNGVLNASKVETKSAASASADNNTPINNPSTGRVFEMYGAVSDWVGVNAPFTLTRMGAAVQARMSGSTRSEQAPVNGSFVEAKGYMDANRVFQVLKLEVKNGFHSQED